jgi:hypothetical protein
VLALARKKPEDVDQILVVGGSSMIPKVHLLIEGKLGKKPFQGLPPREAVVQGAAFLAAQLKQMPDSVAFYDICPLTIGIEVEAGEFLPIIRCNERIPASSEVTLRTAEYGQTEADLRVFEGEGELCADNHLIGTYTIQGIPAADPTQIELIVMFHLDLEGILEIEARVNIAGGSTIKLTVMAEPYELAPHRMHSLQMPRRRRYDRSCAFQWQLVAFCRGARRYLQELQNDDRFRRWVRWDRLRQYMARLDMEERRAAVLDDLPSRKLRHNLSRMLSLWLIHTQTFLPLSLDLSPGTSCEFEDDWVE